MADTATYAGAMKSNASRSKLKTARSSKADKSKKNAQNAFIAARYAKGGK